MKTVIGWVRVSTTKDEQATSPEHQRAMIERECETQGWQLAHVFEETASAFNTDRGADYRQVEAYLRSHPVDYVVVTDMSRWSRNKRFYLNFQWDVLDPLGVELYLIRGMNGPAEEVELIRLIDIWLAEQESKRISKRTRDGLRELAETGGWGNGIPFGYRSSKEDRPKEPCVLLKHPEQWPVVEQIYQLAADGFSGYAIAKRLDLPDSSVYRILRSPVYEGKVLHNGKVYEGAHPGLASELVTAARANLSQEHHTRAQPGKYILSNLCTSHYYRRLRDGSQGAPLNIHGEEYKGERRYRVDKRLRSNSAGIVPADDLAALFPPTIDADALETAVLQKLIAQTESSPLLNEKLANTGSQYWQERIDFLEADLHAARNQQAGFHRRLDKALDYELEDDAHRYSAQLALVGQRIQAIDNELATARLAVESIEARSVAIVNQVHLIRELWKKGSRRTLRDMLSATFLKIDLRTDGKDILGTIYVPDIPALNVQSPGEVGTRGTCRREIDGSDGNDGN